MKTCDWDIFYLLRVCLLRRVPRWRMTERIVKKRRYSFTNSPMYTLFVNESRDAIYLGDPCYEPRNSLSGLDLITLYVKLKKKVRKKERTNRSRGISLWHSFLDVCVVVENCSEKRFWVENRNKLVESWKFMHFK